MNPPTLPEHFFRHEYSRLVAMLSRRVGVRHLETVEDAVQSALAVALEEWKRTSLPENPTAWLYRVAANRLMGDLRQHVRRQRILETYATTISPLSDVVADHEIEDDLLRMLFFCCDSRIPLESQIVLALKTLCGFDVREIALRLFTSEENIYKRLNRARGVLRRVTVEVERSAFEHSVRLPAVHQVLHLLFNEGYLSTHAEFSVRNDLCLEAIRLTTLLAQNPVCATPETAALLALMTLHSARMSARVDGAGGLILLEEQDRGLWDKNLIQSGLRWLKLSAQGDRYSRYHAEAAISAEHCLAPSFSETRWDHIVRQYDLLLSVAPSAILELNRAVAVAELRGPGEALSLLRDMSPPRWIVDSYLWAAVLADLHLRNHSEDVAAGYVLRAYEAAPSQPIRELLRQRFERY